MMSTAIEAGARAIVYRTRGSRHGGITRLMSPGDLGEFGILQAGHICHDA